MKKNYIQPSVKENAMNMVQNLMSASNPWNESGVQKSGDEEQDPMF